MNVLPRRLRDKEAGKPAVTIFAAYQLFAISVVLVGQAILFLRKPP